MPAAGAIYSTAATGLAVLLAFLIIGTFESYQTARTATGTEAAEVQQLYATARLTSTSRTPTSSAATCSATAGPSSARRLPSHGPRPGGPGRAVLGRPHRGGHACHAAPRGHQADRGVRPLAGGQRVPAGGTPQPARRGAALRARFPVGRAAAASPSWCSPSRCCSPTRPHGGSARRSAMGAMALALFSALDARVGPRPTLLRPRRRHPPQPDVRLPRRHADEPPPPPSPATATASPVPQWLRCVGRQTGPEPAHLPAELGPRTAGS